MKLGIFTFKLFGAAVLLIMLLIRPSEGSGDGLERGWGLLDGSTHETGCLLPFLELAIVSHIQMSAKSCTKNSDNAIAVSKPP